MDQRNRYNRWGDSDSPDCLYLIKYYQTKNNKQLAEDLCRTYDSVRKQAKKLGLKRIKKVKVKQPPKKRGRKPVPKNVFDMVVIGYKIKKKRHRRLKRKSIEQDKRIREKKRAEADLREVVIIPDRNHDNDICVSILLNGKESIIYSKSASKVRNYIENANSRNTSKRSKYNSIDNSYE